MRSTLIIALVVTALTGCSHAPKRDQEDIPLALPAVPIDAITVDARPGDFERRDFALPSGGPASLVSFETRVQITDAQPNGKWAATAAICISAATPEPEVCLRISKYRALDIAHADVIYQATAKSRAIETELKSEYSIKHAVGLTVSYLDDVVRIELNDGEAFEVQLGATPRKVSVGCSSGTCSARFDQATVAPASSRKAFAKGTDNAARSIRESWGPSAIPLIEASVSPQAAKLFLLTEALPYVFQKKCLPLQILGVERTIAAKNDPPSAADSEVVETWTYAACGLTHSFTVKRDVDANSLVSQLGAR